VGKLEFHARLLALSTRTESAQYFRLHIADNNLNVRVPAAEQRFRATCHSRGWL